MGERASSAGDRKQTSETGPKKPKERGRENVAGRGSGTVERIHGVVGRGIGEGGGGGATGGGGRE